MNMISKNMNGFRELSTSELAMISGGVVSFRDGSAQERRDGAIARAMQSQAEAIAEQYGLLDGGSTLGDDGEGASGGSVVVEDFNDDGTADAVSLLDADGNWVRTIGLTEEWDNWADNNTNNGSVAWDPNNTALPLVETEAGFFACLGGGAFGGVGGICGATNPVDVYGYFGVGTPGLDAGAGIASDTEALLEGVSVNVPAASFSPQTGDGALVVGTPGVSVTYGFSISDAFAAFLADLQQHAQDFDDVVDEMAEGITSQYIPSPHEEAPEDY